MTQESAPMPERDVSPATEAGRSFNGACGYDHTKRILAIEQEAAAIERREVVERIRAEWFDHDAVQDGGAYECGCEGAGNHIDIDRTLRAILDELSPPSSDRGASR